jgi:hypothetical protein
MDWSLMQRDATHRFLRQDLGYEQIWVSPVSFHLTRDILLCDNSQPNNAFDVALLCRVSGAITTWRSDSISHWRRGSSASLHVEFLPCGERTYDERKSFHGFKGRSVALLPSRARNQQEGDKRSTDFNDGLYQNGRTKISNGTR